MKKRQLIYIGVIGILLLFYAARFLPGSDKTNNTASSAVDNQRLRTDLEVGYKELEALESEMQDLKQEAAQYWRDKQGAVPTSEIQAHVLDIGRKHGVNLKYVGSPKALKVNDAVGAVDITISATGDIQSYGRFIAAIEASSPKLVWWNCTILPTNRLNPRDLAMSGTIRAYVLTPGTTDILSQKIK